MDWGRTLTNAGRRIRQGAINFLGGVNDTMNYPSIAFGKVGAFLTPEGSKENQFFKSYEQNARGASDMGQNRESPEYLVGRMAPGGAVIAAAPAAGAVTLPGFIGVEATGLSTLAAPLDWASSVDYGRQQSLARKQQIVNSLSKWQSQGVNFNNPRIKPLIQRLILEYNSL